MFGFFLFFSLQIRCLISDMLPFNAAPVVLGCEISPFLAKCCSLPLGREGMNPAPLHCVAPEQGGVMGTHGDTGPSCTLDHFCVGL